MAERDLYAKARIRFLEAVDDTQDVNIYVNDKLIVPTLSYKSTSDYITLQPGTYTINIVSNESQIKLSHINIIIDSGKSYTIAAVGDREAANIFIVQNEPIVPYSEAKMRFLHLGSGIPALDFSVKDRDVVFPDVSFQQVTDYLGLTPMTVDLELRIAGSKQVYLPMPKLTFKPNEAYTVVLAGTKTAPFLTTIID